MAGVLRRWISATTAHPLQPEPTMDLATALVARYRATGDALHTMLHGARPRQRDPVPRLAGSAVVTMEIAGEFLGPRPTAGSTAPSASITARSFPRWRRCIARPSCARPRTSGR
jgi:hypothetical protein